MLKVLLPSIAALTGLIAGGPGLASAATSTGPWGLYGPQLGISYKNQSTATFVTTTFVYAGTTAATQSGSAPIGYMGVYPRLLKNGALCNVGSGWTYNTVATSSLVAWTYNGGCGADGDYQGQGYTKAYTAAGSGYNTYTTYITPIV